MKGNIYQTKHGYLVWFPMGSEKDIRQRFKHYEQAERFLTGLRFKHDEGTLDGRDYRKDNPLGFANLVEKFLHSKRLLKGVKKYEQRLDKATNSWGNRNVKTIGFCDVEHLVANLFEMGYASKYIKDIRDTVKMFYRWLYQSGEITHEQIPRFPIVKASSPYRKIITKEDQCRILEEIRRITAFNPRIYVAVLFLSTYINIRPGELIGIRERDIDLHNGRILINESKTGEPKYIYLLPDDVKLLRQQPKGFPTLCFFRHIKGRGGNAPGSPFGKGYLYKWWKKACSNLRIEDVDLYGGTRHSSAIALRQGLTPEEIKRATGHRTQTAFDRYLEIQGDELRAIYAQTRGEVAPMKKAADRE